MATLDGCPEWRARMTGRSREHRQLATATVVAKASMRRNSLRKSAHLVWRDAKTWRFGRPGKRLCLFGGEGFPDASSRHRMRARCLSHETIAAKKAH